MGGDELNSNIFIIEILLNIPPSDIRSLNQILFLQLFAYSSN